MPRASLRNASQKGGGKELFTSYLKLVASKRCWSFLVRVDRWGWGSAETLLPLTLLHEGVGGAENEEHFAWIIFPRVLTYIHIRWIYLALKTWFKRQEYSKLSAFRGLEQIHS